MLICTELIPFLIQNVFCNTPGVDPNIMSPDITVTLCAPDPNSTVALSGGGPLGLQGSQRPFCFPARALCPGRLARRVGESQVATANLTQRLETKTLL